LKLGDVCVLRFCQIYVTVLSVHTVYQRGAKEMLFHGFDEEAELAPGFKVRLADILK
jgi:hypothetical protein